MSTSMPTPMSTRASTPASAARIRRTAAGAAAGLATAALVLVAPATAGAHVHVVPGSTAAGATTELAFSFSHGCEGSPTTAVEVTMPQEVAAVALIANPGWDVASELVDGARTVVFTADEPMPDGVRETLEVEVTLPEGAADGTVLAFPALQVCETGETLWGDADPESETPAPAITIGAMTDAHGHATEDGAAPEGHAAGQDAAASPAVPVSIAALAVAVLAAVLGALALRRRSRA